jgi:plasmid maintenance system antidote protein VapI
MQTAMNKRSPGRPLEHSDHPIAKIIAEYFGGDRQAAADAWQYNRNTIDQIICGASPVSARLAKRVTLSTGNAIDWKALL